MSQVTRHVSVRGRVQGVGYRDWTRRTAAGLGLSGWVRNRRDGSVEAMIAGEERAVLRMVELCQVGPTAAGVTSVEVSGEAAEPVVRGFKILRTE